MPLLDFVPSGADLLLPNVGPLSSNDLVGLVQQLGVHVGVVVVLRDDPLDLLRVLELELVEGAVVLGLEILQLLRVAHDLRLLQLCPQLLDLLCLLEVRCSFLVVLNLEVVIVLLDG